jgi:hypothetical protein
MRSFLVISILLVAGFFVARRAWNLSERSPASGLSATDPGVMAKTFPPAPAEDLPEEFYISQGMPALGSGWDAPALVQVATALRTIAGTRPLALPGPSTAYGKAFFNKLLHTTRLFPLLSPENKVATYNAFITIFPAFTAAPVNGTPPDRELALLTGMEFELIAGFTEDPAFVKDPRLQKTRASTDLNGNTLIARGENIHFIGHPGLVSVDVAHRLQLIGDTALFRPEARALALNRISPHLPTIISRLGLTNIRPVLEKNLAAETEAGVRDYYTALLLRIP